MDRYKGGMLASAAIAVVADAAGGGHLSRFTSPIGGALAAARERQAAVRAARPSARDALGITIEIMLDVR